ncbi:hypothetical protein Tco_1557752, partial [Tanacetum coccineum]
VLIILVTKIPEEVHLATMALDLTKYLCTAITRVLLLYAATTSNIPDPSILTSDTISSRSKCQLAYIFTKALGRERLEFLINKLGMRSMSPETPKSLAEEEE